MDNALELVFAALAALFTVWNLVHALRLATYRRIRASAELTWSLPRPWFFSMSLGIGAFLLVLTFVSAFVLHRPPMSILALGLMAAYYAFFFPLSFQIRRGFYASGIWSETGFVPYGRVRSLSWIEHPGILLVLQNDGSLFTPGYARLRVPPDRYGEARRILASHIDDESLNVETSILGLDEVEAPAQERV